MIPSPGSMWATAPVKDDQMLEGEIPSRPGTRVYWIRTWRRALLHWSNGRLSISSLRVGLPNAPSARCPNTFKIPLRPPCSVFSKVMPSKCALCGDSLVHFNLQNVSLLRVIFCMSLSSCCLSTCMRSSYWSPGWLRVASLQFSGVLYSCARLLLFRWWAPRSSPYAWHEALQNTSHNSRFGIRHPIRKFHSLQKSPFFFTFAFRNLQ